MGKFKGHWKLTEEQYLFCSKLLNLYRLHTGHKFDKRLRAWIFFNQKTWMRAADFLEFLSLFDICAETQNMKCGSRCPDYRVCLDIYEIISNRSDYSPRKIGEVFSSYWPEPFTLHGEAKELLRLLVRIRL